MAEVSPGLKFAWPVDVSETAAGSCVRVPSVTEDGSVIHPTSESWLRSLRPAPSVRRSPKWVRLGAETIDEFRVSEIHPFPRAC